MTDEDLPIQPLETTEEPVIEPVDVIEPTETIPAVVVPPEPTEQQIAELAAKHGYVKPQPVQQAAEPTAQEVWNKIERDVTEKLGWADPAVIAREYADYQVGQVRSQLQAQQESSQVQMFIPVAEQQLEAVSVPKEMASHYAEAKRSISKDSALDANGQYSTQIHHEMAVSLLAGIHMRRQGKNPDVKGRAPVNPVADGGAPVVATPGIATAEKAGYMDWCKNYGHNPTDKAAIARFKSL